MAARTGPAAALVGLLLAGSLAGCVTASGVAPLLGGTRASGPEAIDARLVPDPEAFRTESLVLYGGETTEPGAWIVHPDADKARRVRLTNIETGAQVDAALLRRYPNASGPLIRISAQAADALGLDGGEATPTRIEALRFATPEELAAAEAAANAPEEAALAEVSGDDIALLDETGAAAEDAAATAPAAEPGIAVTALGDTAAGEAQAPAPEPAIEPGQAAGDVAAGPGNGDNADTGAASAGATAAPGAAAQAGAGQVTTAVEAALAALPGAGGTPAVAAAAPDASDPTRPRPVPRPAPNPATDPATDPITDGRAFVQAGAFTDQAAAKTLAGELRAAGLPVEIRPLTLGGKPVSRVLLGPFATQSERDRALGAVRALGHRDAAPARG